MTEGERMVWAAEFVRRLGLGESAAKAATSARFSVTLLRRASTLQIDDDVRAMVDDMIGVER